MKILHIRFKSNKTNRNRIKFVLDGKAQHKNDNSLGDNLVCGNTASAMAHKQSRRGGTTIQYNTRYNRSHVHTVCCTWNSMDAKTRADYIRD